MAKNFQVLFTINVSALNGLTTPLFLPIDFSWNNLYDEEMENFRNHGDEGEIWFGKETARRIVKWLNDNPCIKKDDTILDIGCGNGLLLVELYKIGFTNLHGIDYSKNAIDLATEVSERRQCSINFFVSNIVEDTLESEYNVCLDKGTYDAISLDPEDAKSKRQSYIENVGKILKDGGYFVITSCNWTDSELTQQFVDLEVVEIIPAPTFKFGGKTGKTVNTVVFRKRQNLVT